MINFFQTNTVTLQHSNGTVVAQHLPVQVDTVNLPWNMEVQSSIPTDWFDIYSRGWTSPVPGRSDYFVDETTGTKYQVFSVTAIYTDHLEVRCTRYSGTTP
jgi:hypothetical protein